MTFLIVLFFLAVLLLVYKRTYFKPISALLVDSDGSCSVVSVKPGKAFYKMCFAGRPGFVSLAPGIVAVFIDVPDHNLSFSSFDFCSPVYLFRYKFFKFRSIDLFDRVVSDCLKKFIKK